MESAAATTGLASFSGVRYTARTLGSCTMAQASVPGRRTASRVSTSRSLTTASSLLSTKSDSSMSTRPPSPRWSSRAWSAALWERMSACNSETTTSRPPFSATISKQSDLPEPVGARWRVSRRSSSAAITSAWLRCTLEAAPSRCSTQCRHSSARRGSDGSPGDSATHPTSKDCAPAQRNVATSASEASARTSLAVVPRPTTTVGRVASPKLSCRGALLGQATGELFDGEPKTGAARDGEPKTPATDAESVAAAPAAVALTAAHGLLA
eukprot:scaffold65089_cov36-Phaeocystis_antarctica.AAC.1